jgi:HSP90 family molecular chaperone
VPYLTEPVDELLVQSLWDYEGKKLKSASKGTLKLGDNQEEKEKAQAELKRKRSCRTVSGHAGGVGRTHQISASVQL